MNTRVSMIRRDIAASGMLTLAAAALLFTCSPRLHPGFSPPRPAPPTIIYSDKCPDTRARCDRDPALIALSTAMMLPPVTHGQADTIKPPLDASARLLRFPDTPATERNEHISILTPPRHMSPLASQRLAFPVPTQRPSPAAPAYRMDLTGNWQGRTLDLAPMSTLREPSGPWSFTVILRYDATGQIQQALLESAALDLPLRDEIVRHLYQCRVTPSGAPGEGRLTVYGPGKP
ncbi:MAG: hypothetical protein ABIH24_11215 [Verrucomicrobiota bacterium]